jgi:hypothetical protein
MSLIWQHGRLAFLAGFLLLCTLSGCTPKSPPVAQPPAQQTIPPLQPPPAQQAIPPSPPAYYEHKVLWDGETIWLITLWYTGTSNNLEAIVKANPELPNPNRIYRGNVIRIPQNLMKRQEPMTQEFVEESVGRAKPRRVRPPEKSLQDKPQPPLTETPPPSALPAPKE